MKIILSEYDVERLKIVVGSDLPFVSSGEFSEWFRVISICSVMTLSPITSKDGEFRLVNHPSVEITLELLEY